MCLLVDAQEQIIDTIMRQTVQQNDNSRKILSYGNGPPEAVYGFNL